MGFKIMKLISLLFENIKVYPPHHPHKLLFVNLDGPICKDELVYSIPVTHGGLFFILLTGYIARH
jgi:hypothetical protein